MSLQIKPEGGERRDVSPRQAATMLTWKVDQRAYKESGNCNIKGTMQDFICVPSSFTMPTIPNFFFISILIICNIPYSYSQCLDDQKTFLLQLKNDLPIDPQTFSQNKLAQWNHTHDCCSWEGVECDGAGLVTGLQLDAEAISGGLPSSLFSLRYLQKLNLAKNDFNFTQIPIQIGNLTYLTHLNLSAADFGGDLPVGLSLLTRLVSLDISRNWRIQPLNEHFNLKMLLQNLTRLRELYLDYIDISIQGSEWAHIISSSLPRLKILSLNGCGLSSPLNQSLLRLHSLSVLKLNANNLSTVVPDMLANFSSLTTLSLSHCSLTGSLSSMLLEALPNLVYLNLGYNSLTGSIPESLFGLSSLEKLKLSNNQFSGTFQFEKIQRLHNLSVLDLSYNNLFVETSSTNSTFPQLVELSLVSCNLHSFPDLRDQPKMEYLDLSNNSITGEIPTWIWDIGINGRFYYFNLSCNLLSGLQTPYHIPSTLWVLDLHSNLLQGDLSTPVPHNTFTSDLFLFSIANNLLSGAIPNYLCNYTSLEVLDLSFNYLSGNIPPCLVENAVSLQVFNLRRNNVTGDIPDTFPANCGLATLDLSNNDLRGDIPKSLGNCKSLVALNVGNNNINDSFPCMLPSSLRLLVLRSNRFYGKVRCQGGNWPNLQIIDISSNNFSGSLYPRSFSSWRGMMPDSDAQLMRNKLNFVIDRVNYYQYEVELTIKGLELELVKIWGDFASIDFSCNNFRGKIPDSIGDLGSLDYLNLSHNALAGAVPKSFGKLRQLGSLDLSVNQLTGTIPMELAELTFLSVLNLSHNKLVGMIPVGPQIHTFSGDSFEGNTGLCGRPLNISCGNTSENGLSPPRLEKVQPHGKMEIEWDYVSAALGYVVGLGSFGWLLLCCRSLRRRYFEKVDEILDKIFVRGNKKRRQGRGRRVPRNLQVGRQ